MEIQTEALENNRAKVTVTIDAKTVSDRMKKQYKDFAKRYNIPGFRRGKAPRPVINNVLGKDYVLGTITSDLVNETVPQAIDQSGLYPAGQADFPDDAMDTMVEDGKDFTYSFEIEVKPEIALSSYEPVAITMPNSEVTDEMVDSEVDDLRKHYYDIVDANANTKVKEENFVDLNMKATDDNGDALDSLTFESTQYGMGSGQMPKTFEDQLLGMKKGESKQFAIDVPADATPMIQSVMGKTSKINFDITVNVVKKRQMPELTDEWVHDKIGFETVDELKDQIRQSIEEENNTALPRLRENRALDALAERLEEEVPESLCEETETNLLQDFFRRLQAQGMTLDSYLQAQGITSQKFRDDVKEQARDMTKQDMALDAWAKHYDFTVTDEEVSEEFAKSGAQDPAAVEQEWRESGQLYLIRQGILRQKASDDVVAKAEITIEAADKADKAEEAPATDAAEEAPAAEAEEAPASEE